MGLIRIEAPFLNVRDFPYSGIEPRQCADLLRDLDTLLPWCQLGDQLGDLLTGNLGLQVTGLHWAVNHDGLHLVITEDGALHRSSLTSINVTYSVHLSVGSLPGHRVPLVPSCSQSEGGCE